MNAAKPSPAKPGAGRNTALRRWEGLTTWPLLVATVVFLGSYAWPILEPRMPSALIRLCHVLVWVTWALFAVDAVVRFVLNRNRRRYLWFHLFDLAIILLSLFRPLKLLRLATMIRFLNRRASRGLRGRLIVYVTAGCVLLLFCGSLAILDAERANPQANIVTFGDALWWAVETMTTVGYGDHFPTTDTGRVVAVAVMVGGITLLGLITATLAAWLVQQVGEEERDHAVEVEQRISELTATVDRLARALERDRRERQKAETPAPTRGKKPAGGTAPQPSTGAREHQTAG